MPAKGTAHFDQYTPQTRAKHEVFEKYLGAYLQALSGRVSAYHYIDGFAGPGSYAQTEAGSTTLELDHLRGFRPTLRFVFRLRNTSF